MFERQEVLRRQPSTAVDQTEQQVMNRYNAGQVSYSDVVNAQVSALSARRAVAQMAARRQNAAVALVRALGGGWKEWAAGRVFVGWALAHADVPCHHGVGLGPPYEVS